jgi:hypothetical protein
VEEIERDMSPAARTRLLFILFRLVSNSSIAHRDETDPKHQPTNFRPGRRFSGMRGPPPATARTSLCSLSPPPYVIWVAGLGSRKREIVRGGLDRCVGGARGGDLR